MVETPVVEIAQVRAEYASARLILENLRARVASGRREPYAGYLPAEIDYRTKDGAAHSARVRDYDVRFLDRVSSREAIEHVDLIHRARLGDVEARRTLDRRTSDLHARIQARFAGGSLVENEWVVPYTSTGTFTEERISNKGATLLDLSRRGIATSDFNLLTASAYSSPPAERERHALEAVRNLERLSGRRLGDPLNPLLIALRSAMPEYVPGFMPTYLNVGYTPAMLPGLPGRYGEDAAARIRLSNRKTILEALAPAAFRRMESAIRTDLRRDENHLLAEAIEMVILREDESLLDDPWRQVLFFLRKAYEYYEAHLDTLRSFTGHEVHAPSVIFQRMVCSVLDEQCCAGVLYSRHPRTGIGVHLQYARAVFGEELMTGRLPPKEVSFSERTQARDEFPAIYHFWPRLAQLEEIFGGPVMVEFTGVHGTFTLLQVNSAELSGVGMLTAVMDLHREKRIGAERVRHLIKPYHIRQIESDAIDPESLRDLAPFASGFSVLPRSAVTGHVCFSGHGARHAADDRASGNPILAKARFTPRDAIDMQAVSGILSLSPAAIHVVTTAQNLGIPALLNLEEDGVRIDEERHLMVNAAGAVLREGDPVTMVSENGTLYVGKAVLAPARLLRLVAGEEVPLAPAEEASYRRWAAYYREYREILESVAAENFESLQDLGHAIRYGKLRGDAAKAVGFVNACFDANGVLLARRLLDTTLGNHLVNRVSFDFLTVERQVKLVRTTLELCRQLGQFGYRAGAFVLGSLISPTTPVAFWRGFDPADAAVLVNEWLLHRKYVEVLTVVGERRISRARDQVLSGRLGVLPMRKALVMELMALKLANHDLDRVRAELPPGSDPQTAEALELLAKPYSEFYDPRKAWTLEPLKALCDQAGLPLPDLSPPSVG